MAKKTKAKKIKTLKSVKVTGNGAGRAAQLTTPQNSARTKWLSGLVLAGGLAVFLLLPRWWQLIGLLAIVFIGHREWQRLAQRTKNPFRWFLIGFFYILASSIAAVYLLSLHPLWFLQVVLIVVATDSAGYIVGKKWGRHKLAPTISPGKTWEGAFGGLALVNLVIYVSAITFHAALRDHLVMAMLSGWVIAVASIFGDLFESYFKRQAGVKDSGNFIPGHGGILDRIDGQLLAMLVAAAVAAAMG
ncbi:MAG: phosphatidate cytidylyltransferase [Hydrotalea sp.]|nr:phosphatidate cytidylyltransferase [Hydrotalea sp.]